MTWMRALVMVPSASTRREVAAALEPCGFGVEEAGDAEAAVAALVSAPYPLVIVDWDAGDAAVECCAAIALLPESDATVLIAVTRDASEARIGEILAAGPWDVVMLPADAARLRARAHDAARRAEAPDLGLLYRSAFEHNPLPMCLVDDETLAFLAVSDGAVRNYGWSREEFARMTLNDIRPPALVPALHAAIERGTRARLVTTHRRKSGEEFISDGVLQRLVVGRRPVRFAVTRDVTEEVRAAEAQRRELAEYREFVERTGDAVFTHRASGEVAYANAAFVAFLGYDSADEILDQPVIALVHPDDRALVLGRIHSIVTTGRPSEPRQLRFVGKDGTPRWAETRGTSTTFEGKPAVMVVARDLTERRKADDALRKSEERFARIFHGNPLSISITRLSDGRFLDVNETFSRTTGYSSDDVVGKTGAEIGIWADPQSREAVYEHVRTHGRARDIEVRVRRKTGEVVTVLMSIEQLDVGGERCTVALASDITERKRLESELRQAQKMEAIGRLAGGIAHDFNNLLTGIRGYGELLASQLPEGTPVRDAAEHIRRAALRGASLTGQLLVFTRRQPMQTRVVALNDVVRQTAALLDRIIGSDVAVELRLADAAGRVRVDPGQLEQVILNLAVNARDAMPGGGRLTLETAARVDGAGRRWAHLVVRDTGSGMSDEVRAHLFEPFFTTKEVGKGTGLGLSIVYGIVEQSGGTIAVDTAVGRGTAFDIALPRIEHDAPAPAPQPSAEAAPRGSETILLVEDDEDVRDFVQFVLRRAGYEVMVAPDGVAALELVDGRARDIRLLLSDVVMPRLNGRELAERLVARQPGLKVLHMSGYPGETGIPVGERYAGASFLQKPFSAEDLLRRVRHVLDGETGSSR